MSAFGAVAEFAVAEVPIALIGTTINLPADSWTHSDVSFVLRTGASIKILPDATGNSSNELGAVAGSAVAEYSVGEGPFTEGSFNNDAMWTWADLPRRVGAGSAPRIIADALTIDDRPMFGSTSVFVRLPADGVSEADQGLRVTRGTRVVITTDTNFDFDIGSIGEGAVAEFAIGEGSIFSQSTNGPDRFRSQRLPARVSAGASRYLVSDPWELDDRPMFGSTSVYIRVPVDLLADVDGALRASSGKRVVIANDAFTYLSQALRSSAGASRYLVADPWSLHDLPMFGSTSVYIKLPADLQTLTDELLRSTSGVAIHAAVDAMTFADANARSSAGASRYLPAHDMHETDKLIEIGARHRKLRVYTILS